MGASSTTHQIILTSAMLHNTIIYYIGLQSNVLNGTTSLPHPPPTHSHNPFPIPLSCTPGRRGHRTIPVLAPRTVLSFVLTCVLTCVLPSNKWNSPNFIITWQLHYTAHEYQHVRIFSTASSITWLPCYYSF